MRQILSALVLMGAVVAVPASGFASQAAGEHPAKSSPAKSTAAVGTHSTSGVIKSMTATSLVLERSGKKPGEMTFTLDSSTQRDAAAAVGAEVSVRYRESGKSYVATAITPRQHAAKR